MYIKAALDQQRDR